MESELIQVLCREDIIMPATIATAVVLIVVANCVAGVIKTITKERTRREIAAFVAEGSMTPEQGERLLRAGKSS